MLSDEVIDKVVERLVNRIEQGNEYVLSQIGNKVDEIGKLKPTQAIQLEQIMKYGGDYEKILNHLSKITKKNKKDIKKMFEEVAKDNYKFAKQFYEYRKKKYIPYSKNKQLQKQVQAIAKLTNDKYAELARSKSLGFSVRDEKGKVIYKGLKSTYNDVIDKAILSVSQGKTTFQDEMYRILKNIGMSGVKTLDFNGRIVRLDSAIRMHLKDALTQLHNELQLDFGKRFGADGVEITVHLNPAPDHELVQGRQFSNEEFDKFQNDEDAISYDGIEFPATSEETGYDRRSISQYNCYHKITTIVLGISKPEYTNEELQKIIDDNHKGFELDGKHYSNYEGTQLQRKIEAEIRKQKDLQILGRTSGNEKLAQESQKKINQLNKKYKQLSEKSGLPTMLDRMRVSGYRPIKVVEEPAVRHSENKKPNELYKSIKNTNGVFVSKQTKEKLINHYIKYYEDRKANHSIIAQYETDRYNRFINLKKQGLDDELFKLENVYECNDLLDLVNIQLVDTGVDEVDFKIVQDITKQVYDLSQKSPSVRRQLDMNRLWIDFDYIDSTGRFWMNRITFNTPNYKKYDEIIKMSKEQIDMGWWVKTAPGKEQLETITHEFGHFLHRELAHSAMMSSPDLPNKIFDYFYNKYGEVGTWGGKYIPYDYHDEVRKEIMYEPIRRLAKKEGLTEKEIIDKYVSKYGKKYASSKNGDEDMFAEMFTNSQLGASNALGDELINFLIELGEWENDR